jgi:CBS domain-containing protein
MTAPPAIRLDHVRVREAMHRGIISVDPATPLREVARLMAERRVHAIAVDGQPRASRPWGIISALEIAAAAATGSEPTAGEAAATEVLTVSADKRLDHAAQLMAEHELAHLIVLDPASGHPAGIISTLDVAAVYGG